MTASQKPVVVVIEGISSGRYYADAAVKRGLEPVVVFPKAATSPAYETQLRAPAVAYWKSRGARVIQPETDSREKLLEVISALRPVGVVSGSELGVVWTDFLTDALGLPGNDPDTSFMRRNKFAMQKRLEACGVDSIRSEKLDSVQACLTVAERWNTWPVVVKPLAGAGSQGVHFCGSLQELERVCTALFQETDLFGTPNDSVLLQEFARGTEYIVNTMSRNGRHCVTDIWRYDKVPVGSKGNAYNYAALVRDPNETEKELVTYAFQVLDALGFRYGPSHTELMLTARGPRLIETAARPMGGFFPPDLMQDIIGCDHASLNFDALIDEKAFDAFASRPYRPSMTALLKVVISRDSHPVQHLYYEAIAAEAPIVKRWEFNLVKNAGQVVETVDLETAAGEVFIADEKSQPVWLAYEAMRKMELECSRRLFADEELFMTTPVLHGAGIEAFTEHVRVPWLTVIRQCAQMARNCASGTSLMVDLGHMTHEETVAFACLLGIYGFREVEYGTYLKL